MTPSIWMVFALACVKTTPGDTSGETGATGLNPCDDGMCPADNVTVANGRSADAYVPVVAEGLAVGDLAGLGHDQIYVANDVDLWRYDGDGWSTPTSIWTSHSGYLYPLIADVTGDGAADLILGMPDADEGAGQVVVFPGPVVDAVSWDTPHFEIKNTGESSRSLGVGDLNHDGAPDLRMGRSIRFGPIDADRPLDGDDLTVADHPDEYASPSPSIGDVTGDGVDDLVILASLPVEDSCDPEVVTLHVFPGPLAPGSLDLADADRQITLPGAGITSDWIGSWEAFRPGAAMAVGDVNADGVQDVAIRVRTYVEGDRDLAELFVYPGPVEAGAVPARIETPGQGVWLADLDNDGYPEVMQASIYGLELEGAPETAALVAMRGPLLDRAPTDAETCAATANDGWPTLEAYPYDLRTGDVDGDGTSDVVYLDNLGFTVIRGTPAE